MQLTNGINLKQEFHKFNCVTYVCISGADKTMQLRKTKADVIKVIGAYCEFIFYFP